MNSTGGKKKSLQLYNMWLQGKSEEDSKVPKIIPLPIISAWSKHIENTIQKLRYLSHADFDIAEVPYYESSTWFYL